MSWTQPVFEHSALSSRGTGIFLLSYIVGCFTAGYYLVRLRTGQDIRQVGSGSVGARNVSRVLGSVGFVVTLIIDAAKGALMVWAIHHFTRDNDLAMLSMIGVVLGHIFPAQLRFGGGKGVATYLGALLLYDYHLLLFLGGAFTCLFALMRKTTLSALLAFLLIPLASIFAHQDRMTVVGLAIISGLILLAHRKNVAEEISYFVLHRSIHTKPD